MIVHRHLFKSMQQPGLFRAGALLVVGAALLVSQQARCETKEFDWGDLGVSLAGPKTSLGAASSAGSNLRILVSPQRRMSKNYEFEYTNQSQPSSAEATSYVIPGAGAGGSYLAQSALSPNHSSAYSALSASLASLKSRLSARGVSLSSSLADAGAGQTGSLYSSPGLYSAGGADSANQQHQQQQHQSASQQVMGQAQPTYLSVSSQQDSQSASAYTVPPSQGGDNKTIVLAIPAKINFLTGSKQQAQQQQPAQQPHHHHHNHQQQQQQVTVIQSDGQQASGQYGAKQQLGVINGQEVVAEQPGQLMAGPADGQEHHQYVIVNSAPTQSADYHSHSVAASLSPSPVHAQTIYSSATLYQPTSGASIKYSSSPAAYTQQQGPQQQQQPLAGVVQQPKYYSMIEQSPSVGQQPVALAAGPMQAQPVYETAVIEQQQPPQQTPQRPTYSYSAYPAAGSTSSGCPDTCNSADHRWRKYTVSEYKSCCSRSSQYDSSFEQPSSDKLGEASSKYSDDAYYGYLYRKSRARRSRRQRTRYNNNHHQRYRSTAGAATAPAASSPSEEEEPRQASIEQSGDGRASRSQYGQEAWSSSSTSTSPYMRYYRSQNQQYSASDERDVESGPSGGSAAGSKYAKETRAYRRGRSRDLEATLEPQQANQNEPNDDQDSGAPLPPPPSSGYGRGSAQSGSASALAGGSYGAGDYSVDAGSRYAAGPQAPDEEEPPARGGGGYVSDEAIGSELDKNVDSDYASGEPPVEPADEAPEQTAYNKYQSSGRRMRKAPNRNRRKQSKETNYTKYGQQKKMANNRKSKSYAMVSKAETSQTNNATGDYDSAQAGDYHHHSSGSPVDASDEEYSSSKNDNNNENSEPEKESVGSKYKASLNETAVANLSKTTMHLKEILSLLEKKAQYTLGAGNNAKNSNETSQANSPATSTPSPYSLPITTTTSSLYPMSSMLFGSGSSYAGSLPSEYLSSELSMKTPYRYEPSLTSSLGSSLSLPSSFGSLSGSDSFGLSSYTPGHGFGLHPGKPLHMSHGPGGNMAGPGGHHPRKRRVNKNSLRYNELMLQKAAHGLGMSPSFLSAAAAKNRLLNQAYYPTLQHPYLYRGSAPSITNPYPYKNIHKNPYPSLFQGPVSSKLALSAAAAGLYSDDSRGLHGLGGSGGGVGPGAGGPSGGINSHDPLSNVASSLRPSTTMRLRSKPFVFQPQVLPIYSRHTILTQPLDVKA